jgi:hypothetical protein
MESLNESWAVFFDILTTFFLFGIGIPSLIIQITASEDIKRVAFRNRGWAYQWFIIALIFGFLDILFIWILHPTQSRYMQLKMLFPWIGTYYQQLKTLFPWINAYGVAAFIIIGAFGLVFYVWWGQFRYDRAKVIKGEVDRYIKFMKTTLKRNVVLNRSNIQQSTPDIWGISYLGENGAAGVEKDLVLEALQSIVESVFKFDQKKLSVNILIDIIDAVKCTLNKNASNGNYLKGIQVFENIIDHISAEYDDRKDIFIKTIKTVETTLKTGDINEFKYQTGITALSHIIIATVKIDKENSPILVQGLQTIQHLSDIAYKEEYRVEISQIIGIVALTSLGPDNFSLAAARVLLDQGVTSITGKYYDVAVEILNRFETMMEEYNCLEAKTAQFYLGLVAHFWCSGNAARQRALAGLKRQQYNRTELKLCLRKVRDLHYYAARFETADKLDIMIKEYPKAKF